MGEKAEESKAPAGNGEEEKKEAPPPAEAGAAPGATKEAPKKEAADAGHHHRKELSVDGLITFEYEVAKWIAKSHLKYQRKLIQEEIDRMRKINGLKSFSVANTITDVVSFGELTRENRKLKVNEYWSDHPTDIKYKGLNEMEIQSLLMIQAAFRMMLVMKRLRDHMGATKKAGMESFGPEKTMANTLMIQATIRRVLALRQVEARIRDNSARDENFARFCLQMKEGIRVTMYSRKYKTAPMRTIQFSKDLNNIEFTASFGSRGKIEMKRIFKVNMGQSGTKYGEVKMAPLSKSLCLECLGNRVVDFACETARDARFLFNGFKRLIEILAGKQSPFYIDDLGIPKRAGPSILENSIKQAELEGDHTRKPYKSTADEYRFWSAVRFLQEEYDSWQHQKDHERRVWMMEQEELERAQERALANGNAKKPAQEHAKVVKLVRFEDPETGKWVIEQEKGGQEEEPEEDEEEAEEETKKKEAAEPIETLQPDVLGEGGGRKKLRRKKEKPPSFFGRIFAKKPPPAGKGPEKEGGEEGKGAGKERSGPLFSMKLNEPVEAGATVLPLDRPKGCEAGMRVVMDKGTDVEETRVISAFGSIILDKPLEYTHPAGATVDVHPPSYGKNKKDDDDRGSGSGSGSGSGRGSDKGDKDKAPEKKPGLFGALFRSREKKDEAKPADDVPPGPTRAPPVWEEPPRPGELGGGPPPGPPPPTRLGMPVLARMNRSLQRQAAEPDDPSERSFATNQSQLESVPETRWDEASTLGAWSEPGPEAPSERSSVWSECIGTDDPPPSVASTFPGVPWRYAEDDVSTVWSEVPPSDPLPDEMAPRGGLTDGPADPADVPAAAAEEAAPPAGDDDNKSQRSSASWRGRGNEDFYDIDPDQPSVRSDDGYSAVASSVKSDKWSEVVSETTAARRAARKPGFWSRILCMAPQYVDGDSDDDYFVKPKGAEEKVDKADKGEARPAAAGTVKGARNLAPIPEERGDDDFNDEYDDDEEYDEEDDYDDAYNFEEADDEDGAPGSGEDDDEYEEDEDGYDDDASDNAVAKKDELGELSDKE